MKTVTFKKVERVCPKNREIKEKGEKRGIIYDYEIWENGVKKGVFWKCWSRGYEFKDNGGDKIKVKGRYILADSQKNFESVYKDYKRYIPTAEQIAEREAKKQREREANEESQRQHRVKHLKELAAPEMYEALKHMLSIFDNDFEAGTIGENVCNEAKQALKKAEERE